VTRLVLFDIDGTLVLTGGAGGRAMTRAFEDLFGVADAFSGIPMPGRTDSWILTDAAALHGIPAAQLSRFPGRYLTHLRAELDQDPPVAGGRGESKRLRKGVMPGVRPLLDALAARDDVYLALLTGNYEEAARAKLEYFDLWRYFRCGAFGDDAPDRNGLVPKALAVVRACGGPHLTAEHTVVVGDTPLDVACAAASGARSIAVATGGYDVDALRGAGADVVFEDLSDTGAVVAALMGENRR
jgi:phosphoglycolate phosphatase